MKIAKSNAHRSWILGFAIVALFDLPTRRHRFPTNRTTHYARKSFARTASALTTKTKRASLSGLNNPFLFGNPRHGTLGII
jgi:hypothetical protein